MTRSSIHPTTAISSLDLHLNERDSRRGDSTLLLSFVAESLDSLPITSFHWRMLSLIIAGLFFDMFDVAVFGSMAPSMIHEGFVQPSNIALIATATFTGLLVGSIGQGELTDRYGRKTIYQANLLIYGLATLAAGFSPNYLVLAGLRFVAGLGLGAEIPLAYSYAAEFAPRASRGRILALVNTLGGSAPFPLAILFSLLFIGAIGWRGIFIVVGAAALVVFLLRIGLPESPRWLAANGQVEAAFRILKSMGISVPPELALETTGKATRLGDPLLLVLRHYPRRLLAFTVAFFCSYVGVYVIATWLPTLMAKEGFGISQSLMFSLVVTSAFPASSLLMIFILDRVGRIRVITWSFVIAAAFTLLFVAAHSVFARLVAGFLMSFFIVTTGNVLSMMSGELFPTEVRSSGAGLGLAAGRLGAVMASYIVLAALNSYGVIGVFVSVSGILLCGATGILFLGFEPAKRSLEEIAFFK